MSATTLTVETRGKSKEESRGGEERWERGQKRRVRRRGIIIIIAAAGSLVRVRTSYTVRCIRREHSHTDDRETEARRRSHNYAHPLELHSFIKVARARRSGARRALLASGWPFTSETYSLLLCSTVLYVCTSVCLSVSLFARPCAFFSVFLS